MTSFKSIFLYFIVLLAPMGVIAQYNDLGLWQNLTLEKKINQKWIAHISERVRFNNNISQLYYIDCDMGITYRLNKKIHFSLDYVYIDRLSSTQQFGSRHQYYFNIVAKKKWNNLSLSYRGMIQMEYRQFLSSENGLVPDFIERNKFTLKYKTPFFTPYLASEIYLQLTGPYAMLFNRNRYFVGTFYQLNKVDELEFYFLYEHNYMNVNPPQKYVIGIGFSHTFY